MDKVLLIAGAGEMGKAHARAASELGWEPHVVCRGEESSRKFMEETSLPCTAGGIEAWLAANPAPRNVVVAVGLESLSAVGIAFIRHGARRLLLEKPAGLNGDEIADLAEVAAAHGAEVFVAYNRRFYRSVFRAAQIIEEDGGPTSLRFDFTERVDLVASSKHPPIVKQNWFLANSTHVIDLAFFLAGRPVNLTAHSFGGLDWHSIGSRFVGSGRTVEGAAFSYSADWEAPGRWFVDVRTRRRRLLLEPLEKLRIQRFGSFDLVEEDLEETSSPQIKEGILAQMAAFLLGQRAVNLLPLDRHLSTLRQTYLPILTGTSPAAERQIS